MATIKYRPNATSPWTIMLGSVGPAGPRGEQGPAGEKPVKGVDYMTEEDLQEIAALAVGYIPNVEEVKY